MEIVLGFGEGDAFCYWNNSIIESLSLLNVDFAAYSAFEGDMTDAFAEGFRTKDSKSELDTD